MKVWIATALALLAEMAHAAEPVMVGSDVPGVAVTSLSYCPDCEKHEVGVDLGDVAVRSPYVQALVTACGAVGKLYVRGRGSRAIGCRLQPTAPGVLSGPMPVLSMAKAPLGEFVTLSVRPFGRPRFAVAPVSASEMATLQPVFAAWMRKFNKQNQLTDEAALRAPAATDKAPMRQIEVADDEWFVLTAVYTGMESDGAPGPGSHSVVFHRFGKHLRVVGDFIGQVVSVGEVTGDGLPSLEVDDEIGQTHSWLRLLPHLQEIMGWENPND